MCIGNFGVGFAVKPLAAQFIDLLWPRFLTLGWESVRIAPGITRVTPLEFTHYRYSHSLLAVLGWAGGRRNGCW